MQGRIINEHMTIVSTDIKEAANVLNDGHVIAIPTETVYGLAGNIYHEQAVQQIFQIKKRPSFNPLIVHIADMSAMSSLVTHIPETAKQLAAAFWPGPLTLVLPKQPSVPDSITAGKNTVAIRIPNHPMTLELLSMLNFPLAAPSANPFGSISPTRAIHVKNYFDGILKMVLDGGICRAGIESTIIGFRGDEPVLYRQGSVSQELIETVTGPISVQSHNNKTPEAPGMLWKHYAPLTPCVLTDDPGSIIYLEQKKKIGLLSFRDGFQHPSVICKEILSPSGDMYEAAANLYHALHTLDRCGAELIVAEKLPDSGLGKTINDRLQRASFR